MLKWVFFLSSNRAVKSSFLFHSLLFYGSIKRQLTNHFRKRFFSEVDESVFSLSQCYELLENMIVFRCLFNLPRFVLLLFTVYLRQLLIAIISEQGLQIKFLTIFHKKN